MAKALWSLLAAGILVAGCGGPSSESAQTPPGNTAEDPIDTGPSEDPSKDPDDEPILKTVLRSNIFLSGIAAQSSTGDQAVAEAQVNIAVIDEDEEGQSRRRNYLAQTDASGRFTLLVRDVAVSGENTQIRLVANKAGLTESNRRISRFSQDDVQIINATLVMTPEIQAVQTITREAEEEDLAFGSAYTEQSVRFQLYQSMDGTQFLTAGNDEAMAMAMSGQNPSVDVNIPVENIDLDVNTVVAGIQGFTPSDPEQAQSFPGEFIGIGDDSDIDEGVSFNQPDASDDVYRLISTAFSQVRLRDQEDNTLGLDFESQAAAASSRRPTVTMMIDPASYSTITEDRNESQPGVQVPIYIFSDDWYFAGNGTLMQADGVGSYSRYVHSGEYPIKPSDVDGELYVELPITKGNEWITWLNLDWPARVLDIATSDYKLSVKLQYNGNPLQSEPSPFTGYVDLTLPDGSRVNTYVANGIAEFEGAIVSERFSTDAADWTLSFINALTGSRVNLPLNNLVSEINEDAPTELGAHNLSNPLQCLLKGTVSKDGIGALEGHPVTVSGNRFWRQVQSNSGGQYQLLIPCERELSVARAPGDSEVLKVNADGVLNLDENGDVTTSPGFTVTANISFDNLKPVISGVSGPSTIVIASGETRPVDFTITAYDLDSEALEVSWACIKQGVATASSVEIERTEQCVVNSAGVYQWVVEVSDEINTVSRSGYLEVTLEQENRLPRLSNLTRGSTPVSCALNAEGVYQCADVFRPKTLGTYQYDLLMIDPDGDSLTYSWEGSVEGRSYSIAGSEITGTMVLSAEVSDGEAIRSLELTITSLPNEAPVILGIESDPTSGEIIGDEFGNLDPVDLWIFGADDVTATDSLIVWVQLGADNYNPLTYDESIGAWQVILPSDTLPLGETLIDVYVEDDEGASSSQSFNLTVVEAQEEDQGNDDSNDNDNVVIVIE